VEAAFAVDEKVILEKFIAGREMTVAILEGRALPVVEIAPKSGVYDFHSKYTKGASEYFAPANVPAEISDKLCNEALLAWKALNLENYARIDFRLTPEGKTYFLEANTLPGMTELSLFPMAGGAAGYDFGTVLEMIIASAKKRFTRKRPVDNNCMNNNDIWKIR
jgi:D-alanine-D-alanine ligase